MGETPIRVAVCGALGRMGKECCRTVLAADDLQLTRAVDRLSDDRALSAELGVETEIGLEKDLHEALKHGDVDVLVDFTHPAVAAEHARMALELGVAPVIGTSGLSSEALADLTELAAQKKLPGLWVPNFAIGAVLMMQFAAMAAKFLPHAEIIELHHDRKVDAPSGTATRTASLIQENRREPIQRPIQDEELVPGARGSEISQVHVHSVRLPGLLAHQEVVFGGQGELLTIRHDSFDRGSFMEGVKFAVRNVRRLEGFAVGLEHLMELA